MTFGGMEPECRSLIPDRLPTLCGVAGKQRRSGEALKIAAHVILLCGVIVTKGEYR